MDVLWGGKEGKLPYFQTRPGVKLLLDNWLNMILNISDNGSAGRSCCSRCQSLGRRRMFLPDASLQFD